jgi:hypothetical protein
MGDYYGDPSALSCLKCFSNACYSSSDDDNDNNNNNNNYSGNTATTYSAMAETMMANGKSI